jgi:hypothetical protein
MCAYVLKEERRKHFAPKKRKTSDGIADKLFSVTKRAKKRQFE